MSKFFRLPGCSYESHVADVKDVDSKSFPDPIQLVGLGLCSVRKAQGQQMVVKINFNPIHYADCIPLRPFVLNCHIPFVWTGTGTPLPSILTSLECEKGFRDTRLYLVNACPKGFPRARFPGRSGAFPSARTQNNITGKGKWQRTYL